MKKIIALAVAAVVAAPAMADLTISGTVAAGWSGSSEAYSDDDTAAARATAQAFLDADVANGNCDAACEEAEQDRIDTFYPKYNDKGRSGFGIDTASLKIAGSETMENGLTVSGYMTIAGLQRSGGVEGENSELAISGDFGKVAVLSQKSGAYTESYGPADNFVGEFLTEGVSDVISYTSPALMDGMLTLVVDTADAGGIGKANSDYDPQITAKFAAGMFSGRVAYKMVDNGENRVRVGGTMDLGMVKLAAAYQDQDKGYTYTSGGVVVPMGATTLGLSFAQKEVDGKADMDGMSFGVEHELSSSVSVSAKVNKFDSATTGEEESAGNVLVTLAF